MAVVTATLLQSVAPAQAGDYAPRTYTIAGGGTGGDNGPATAASLSKPAHMAFDSAGNLYFAEYTGHRVRRVDVVTKAITTVAGTGVAGFSGDTGLATAAQLKSPFAVAFVDDDLYISDYGNHRIRKVDAVTKKITTVAGTGTAGTPGAANGNGGPAIDAKLYYPAGLGYDGEDHLYFADSYNNQIRLIDLTAGKITAIAGTGVAGWSGDGSSGGPLNAQLNLPHDVKLDNNGGVYSGGGLYIADYGNHRIRLVKDGIITTVAGTGTAGYNGDNLEATAAKLYRPFGVALDSTNALYIADYGNHRIRKVSGGTITTVAGIGTAGYNGDGKATETQLNLPYGVTIDSTDGNLFIGDSSNGRVRRVTLVPSKAEVMLKSSSANVVEGAPIDLDVDVTGMDPWLLATPTSTVSFVELDANDEVKQILCETDLLESEPGVAGQSCAIEGDVLAPGAHTLVADYIGDAIYYGGALSNKIVQTVTTPTPVSSKTTIASSKNPSTLGESVMFTAQVSGTSSGIAPTGTVTFWKNNKSTAICTNVRLMTSLGITLASCSVSNLALGSSDIMAVYSGDVSYNGSTAVMYQTVKAPKPTINLGLSTNATVKGNPVTFTATVLEGYSPTGTVTFYTGTTVRCGPVVVNAGMAVCSVNTASWTAGSYSVKAVYDSNSGYNEDAESTTQSLTLTTTSALSSVVVSGKTSSQYGDAVTFTAKVTGSVSGSTPSGKVTFKSSGYVIPGCQDLLLYSGGVSCNLPSSSGLNARTHVITASYSGNSQYPATNATGMVHAVASKGSSSVRLSTPTSSENPAMAGSAPKFTATVYADGSTLKGNTLYIQSSAALCSASLVDVGVGYSATCTLGALGAGTHTLAATYVGNSSHNGGTSSIYKQTILASP